LLLPKASVTFLSLFARTVNIFTLLGFLVSWLQGNVFFEEILSIISDIADEMPFIIPTPSRKMRGSAVGRKRNVMGKTQKICCYQRCRKDTRQLGDFITLLLSFLKEIKNTVVDRGKFFNLYGSDSYNTRSSNF
jgi:hypothetical protein